MANLRLEVVTPKEVLLQAETDYVTIPGEMGEMGILPGHLPVLTSLTSGVLTFKEGGKERRIAVHHGFAQVHQDKVTVVAKVAEHGEGIDEARAKKAYNKAKERLGKLSDAELDREQRLLEGKLIRSLTRQHAASGVFHH